MIQDRAQLHETIKTLVVAYGPREAARQAGISENTVLSLAKRKGWKQAGQIISTVRGPKLPQSNAIASPSVALETALNSHKSRSIHALGKYAAEAAEQAAAAENKIQIAGKVRDIAGVHATLWPTEAKAGLLRVGILIGTEQVTDIQPGTDVQTLDVNSSLVRPDDATLPAIEAQ
jgi:hypothetical protein